jgi:hypothetical protein
MRLPARSASGSSDPSQAPATSTAALALVAWSAVAVTAANPTPAIWCVEPRVPGDHGEAWSRPARCPGVSRSRHDIRATAAAAIAQHMHVVRPRCSFHAPRAQTAAEKYGVTSVRVLAVREASAA